MQGSDVLHSAGNMTSAVKAVVYAAGEGLGGLPLGSRGRGAGARVQRQGDNRDAGCAGCDAGRQHRTWASLYDTVHAAQPISAGPAASHGSCGGRCECGGGGGAAATGSWSGWGARGSLYELLKACTASWRAGVAEERGNAVDASVRAAVPVCGGGE